MLEILLYLMSKIGGIADVQDKDCNMEIVGNNVLGFLMLNLDTL
jgi:hypothetical protein